MANTTIHPGPNSAGRYEGSSKKKLSHFDIFLSGDNDYYLPGEDITGQVIIHCTKSFKTKGISVRILGSCFVSDSKRHNHNNEDNYRAHYTQLEFKHKTLASPIVNSYANNTPDMRRYYKDTEVYFHIKQQVWGGFESQHNFETGQYSFPFNITLPLSLPSSFEGTRGYVRYTVTAKIKRQRAPSLCSAKHFRVNPKVDFRSVPNAEKPVIANDSKHYGFLMFKGGSIEAKVSLNRKVFLPGENIILNAEINNNTNKETTLTNAVLLSLVTYRVQGDVKEETAILNQITHGAIRPHDKDVWVNREIFIPQAAPPSGLNGCGLIVLEYRVQFTISTPMGSDMEIALPIVIGAEPSAAHVTLAPSAEAATAEAAAAPHRPPPRPPRPSHHEKQLEVEASMQQFSIAPPTRNPIVEITGATLKLVDTGSIQTNSQVHPAPPPPSYEECIAEDQSRGSGQTLNAQYSNNTANTSGQSEEHDDKQNDERVVEHDDEHDDEQDDEQEGEQNDGEDERQDGEHDSAQAEAREREHNLTALNYRLSVANDDNKLLIDL